MEDHFFLKQQSLGALLFDLHDGRILAVNKRAEQILNKKKEIIVKNGIAFFLPEHFTLSKSHFATPGIIWEGFLALNQEQLFISIFNDGTTGIVSIFALPTLEPENSFLFMLRMLVSSLDFDGLVLDLQGNIKQITRGFADVLKYDDSELLGRQITEVLIPDSQKEYWRLFFKQLREEQSVVPMFQMQMKMKDGQKKEFVFHNSLITDAAGQAVGTLSLCLEYSYLTNKILRRGVSGRLVDIIARISSMFAQSPSYKLDDCINDTLKLVGEYAQVDRSYVFLFRDNLKVMDNTHEWCAPGVEPQIENLQGLPSKIVPWWMKYLLRNEIIHIPKVSALPEEASNEKEILEAQDIKSLIVVPMTEGETLIGFIGFDSVQRPKFWSNEDINLLKIVSSVFVSSLIRKNAELTLADTEKRYRTIFSLAPDLLVVLDYQAHILSLNPAFKRITGLEIETVLKKPFSHLLIEKERTTFTRNFKICLKEGTPLSREYHLKSKNGVAIVDLKLVPLTERGKIVGVFGIGRDITEKKSLEKNLREAERLKSIGTLAGGIAHDFNNILNILLSNYSILKNALTNVDQDISDSFDLIRQAIERGKNLVQNLLTFASKKEPIPVTLDLNNEVRHVVKLLQQTTTRSIHFDLKLTPDALWISFDQIQLHQVILNLCLNAIDAILARKPQGTITIRTQRLSGSAIPSDADSAKQSTFCLLEVEDDGIGIEPETQKFLFDPFFTTKRRGTGLGLSVVFGSIKSFGGKISLKSKPGVGTTFQIVLPLVKGEKRAPKPISKQLPSEKFSAPPGTRIVLVEDDVTLSKMLTFVLKRFGFQVEQIFDGSVALDYLLETADKIDALILDFDLPGKNGWQIAQPLLQSKRDLKMIITSGYLLPEIRTQLRKNKGVRVIEKPFEPEQLLEVLKGLISSR